MGLIKPLFTGRRGSVRMMSRHKILHQLAEDILEGLSEDDLKTFPDIVVLVGCHQPFPPRHYPPACPQISIHIRHPDRTVF